jgi:hypothetical protein
MSQSRIRSHVLVLVGVVGLALGACGGDGDEETTSSASGRPTPGCQPTETSSTQRMSVQPCENLVDGEIVKVYAAAFTPGVEVEVAMCASDSGPGGAGCDTNDVVTAEIGAGGSVVVDYPVRKVLTSKEPVDCTAASCVLTMGEPGDDGERADPVAVSFLPELVAP